MRLRETPATPVRRAIDPMEFLQPIEFLRSNHQCQRSFCEQLNALIADLHQPERQDMAFFLLEFTIIELPWSLEDEQDSLAPALLQRCFSEDSPKEILANLLRQHQAVAAVVPQVIDGLDRMAEGSIPVRPLDFIMAALQLVDILTCCVDWEDKVMLPLAAARLTNEEKIALGSSFAQRRGVSLPLPN